MQAPDTPSLITETSGATDYILLLLRFCYSLSRTYTTICGPPQPRRCGFQPTQVISGHSLTCLASNTSFPVKPDDLAHAPRGCANWSLPFTKSTYQRYRPRIAQQRLLNILLLDYLRHVPNWLAIVITLRGLIFTTQRLILEKFKFRHRFGNKNKRHACRCRVAAQHRNTTVVCCTPGCV